VKPGDLVKFDSPGQRAHGKVGLIVDKVVVELRTWKIYSYDVLIDGEVRRCVYENLLAEEDWDEAG
jgi:hypothetical protein